MGRPKESLIDRQSIVATTIRLLEKDGLDDFNLRKLAHALAVNPASFYHYFDGKEAILRSAAGHILREVPVPNDDSDWKKWMVETSINYWSLLVRKPFLAPIMIAGFRPKTEVTTRNQKMMTDAGIPQRFQEEITRAFEGVTIGSSLMEVARLKGESGSKPSCLDPEETLRHTLTLMLDDLIARTTGVS